MNNRLNKAHKQLDKILIYFIKQVHLHIFYHIHEYWILTIGLLNGTDIVRLYVKLNGDEYQLRKAIDEFVLFWIITHIIESL